jgi:hypothetical protein
VAAAPIRRLQGDIGNIGRENGLSYVGGAVVGHPAGVRD